MKKINLLQKIFLIGIAIAIPISTFAIAEDVAFLDVPDSHPNAMAIDYLESLGIISGNGETGLFEPEKEITRAAAVKILVEDKAGTPDENTYHNCFPDVEKQWYAKYICYAREQGWVDGHGDGFFRPGDPVRDIEWLKMVLETEGIALDTGASQMLPVTEVDKWFYPYVTTAENLNLIGNINVGENYRRGDVVDVLFRWIVIRETGTPFYTQSAASSLVNANQNQGAIYEVYTPEKFQTHLDNKENIALFFHADWCAICKSVEAQLKNMIDNGELPIDVKIMEVNFDANQDLRQEYEVLLQYSFVFFDENGYVKTKNIPSGDKVKEEMEAIY